MRLRACDQCTSSTLIGGKGRDGPSSLLHTTLERPTEYVDARWIGYMDSYMVSNGSYFMVTWTILKTHLLEVGLTLNRWESVVLRTLTTVGLFYFIMREDSLQ